MVGEPVFAVIMITIGLLFIIEQAITAIWGFDNLNLADPWGVETVTAGDVVMAVRDLWTLGIAAAVLGGFFAVLPPLDARRRHARHRLRRRRRRSPRASAPGACSRSSWAISAGLAALAGVTLAVRPGGARRRRSARSRWWRSRR